MISVWPTVSVNELIKISMPPNLITISADS